MRPILLLAKANPYHDRLGRFARAPEGREGGASVPEPPQVPPSAGISTERDARKYWDQHYGGKTIALRVIDPGSGKTASVSFSFLRANTHAWTRGAAHGEPVHARDASGPRTFDAKRAKHMDLILPSLIRPWKVLLDSDGRHVYLGVRIDQENAYYMVFSVDAPGKCSFVTAQPRTMKESRLLVRRLTPATIGGLSPAALQKAMPPSLLAEDGGLDPVLGGFEVLCPPPFGGPAAAATSGVDRPAIANRDLAIFLGLFKAIPPGARWITIHPHGKEEKGQPVLIQPQADGSAKVIGGAGGKLNHLRLRGVRDPGEYKAEASAREKLRREERKRQAARDKEAGLTEAKARAAEVMRAQLGDARAKFIETVSKALGWTPEQTRFPEEKFQNATPDAVKKAAERHATEVFKAAREAVQHQRERLVSDAEARDEAGLGEVPLTTSGPDQISVADLDPAPAGAAGLGFQPDYKARAEAAGLTAEERQEEAAEARHKPLDPEAARARRDKAAAIAAELEQIRDPGPKVDPKAKVEAKQAIELIKAEKQLRAVEAQAREKAKKLREEAEKVEPAAYVLAVGNAPVDEAVQEDLENDLRTLRTRAFLDQTARAGIPADALARHVGVGAFNAVNSVALAAGGAALLDRSAVDVLGIAGAAQVLARRLASDLTKPEMDDLREAMGRFHVDHYMRTSDAALREARDLQEMAAEIEVGEAARGADLAVAQELNAKRREFTRGAQRILGTALGEMEANAAIVLALGQGAKDQLEMSMGKVAPEDAVTRLRALGLQRGEYAIERVGATTMLTLTGAGMDRLAKPISREDLQRTRTAMDIIEGRKDEAGWLPGGVADRPDLAMDLKPGVAPRLAQAFPQQPQDVAQAVRDFIGGRSADGEAPADILASLLSEETIQRAGDREAFMRAVEDVAPLYDAKGQMIRAEAHTEAFDRLADDFVARRHGAERSPLNRQQVPVDQVSVDALHRALAAHPEGAAAFVPVGELTRQQQGQLRDAFGAEFARTDPKAAELRERLAKLDGEEPPAETEGLFGVGPNPEHARWRQERDALAEQANAATMTWGKYVEAMGGPAHAYAAMQDVVRSKVTRAFAETHNRLRPDQPVKIGRAVIRGDLEHLDAIDPAARERRLAERRALADSLRNRVAGRYASGSVAEKMAAARAAEEAAAQAQMGLFAMEEPPPKEAGPEPERPLEMGQRWSIGHAAERTIAGMMPHVAANFRPGTGPVKLWKPDMSGKYVSRQRAVKLIEANRRVVLGMGTGSGKTSIMLAAFTHLHGKGKAKRGLFVVPSVVQGQFHGEALTMLQPGKFKWHADPGASREERLAAYRDPGTHFVVATHQGLRDDLMHLAAERDGITPAAAAEKVRDMPPAERKAYMGELMKHAGMGDIDFLATDEAHGLLNRAGKEDSRMAAAIDGVADNMGTYVSATADPVKNDATELYDVLAKMDRNRYGDRDAFMRRYGADTPASRDALRREMVRHFYTAKIDPGVQSTRKDVPVKLDEQQHARLRDLADAAGRVRLARANSTVDVAAAKALSPRSFEGVPEAQHEAVAKELARSIGIVHATAVQHTINGGAKIEALATLARERKGKPGVVFAHHLDHVEAAAARLRKEGLRVATLTGAHSSEEKDRIKRQFQAGEHDVLVASDAAAVGANLQAGQWLAQVDQPQTAMTHAQRQARINRIGQKNNVELLDLVADHPAEARAKKRLAEKYELRAIATSPMEGLDDTGLASYLASVRAGQAETAQPVYAAPDETRPNEAPEEQASLF